MLKPLTKESFGAGLSVLRRKAKMKQAELGAKIGVAGPTISRWEDGHALPSQDHVEAVCALFQVSEEYFTGEVQKQKSSKAGDKTGVLPLGDSKILVLGYLVAEISLLNEGELRSAARLLHQAGLIDGAVNASDTEELGEAKG